MIMLSCTSCRLKTLFSPIITRGWTKKDKSTKCQKAFVIFSAASHYWALVSITDLIF